MIGPHGATALRLLVASVLLVCLFRPWKRRLRREEAIAILAYGLSLGAMNSLFYLSLAKIPLGIAVALEFTGPLAVSVFSSRKASDYLWALLAILGIALILPLTNKSAPLDLSGVLFALGAGACWAGYIVFGQRASQRTEATTVSAFGMVVAAILVIPFGILHAGPKLLDVSLLPLAIGVGVLSSALPYSLEMVALKRLPAKNFGILMSLEPAIAALSGLVFLSEKLDLLQWGAIACIICASVGSTMTAQAVSPPAQP